MPYHVDTEVLTTNGIKTIGEIQLGDYLLDDANNPVPVIKVSKPGVGELKVISYKKFGGLDNKLLKCTPDQLLRFVAKPEKVRVGKGSNQRTMVYWTTKCCREGAEILQSIMEEICYTFGVESDLNLLKFCIRELFSNIIEGILTRLNDEGEADDEANGEGVNENENESESESESEGVNENQSENESEGVNENESESEDLGSGESEGEDLGEGFVPEEEYEEEEELEEEAFDFAEYEGEYYSLIEKYISTLVWKYKTMDYITTQLYRAAEHHVIIKNQTLTGISEMNVIGSDYYGPIMEPRKEKQADSPTSSSESDSEMVDGNEFEVNNEESNTQLSSAARKLIDKRFIDSCKEVNERSDSCSASCGGIRIVGRGFGNAQNAEIARQLLESPSDYHLVDMLAAQKDEVLLMSIGEFQDHHQKKANKIIKLGLLRASEYKPPIKTNNDNLPLPPYLLGSYLGGGRVFSGAIYSVDFETQVWMKEVAAELDEETGGKHRLECSVKVDTRIGTTRKLKGRVFTAKRNVYRVAVVSRAKGEKRVAIVKNRLKSLGILYKKTIGIPDVYMNASDESKLKVIAALIDTNGYYCDKEKCYVISQRTREHKNIIFKLKKMAESLMIDTSKVYKNMVYYIPDNGDPPCFVPEYIIRLHGESCMKFQKYITLPRKRMNIDGHRFLDKDLTIITQVECEKGEYRSIKVSGNVFQLKNRLIVHD